ncbi:MAG: SRPBCC family protein [Caulobacterales bacterium]
MAKKASDDAEGWIAGERPDDGAIRQIGEDRWEIRIVRQIPRPVEQVWAALTIPERLEDWLGQRADLDLRVGGRYFVWFVGEGDNAVRGVITEYEPPRLIAYDWNFGVVRWELEAVAGGCRLTFSQTGLNAWWLLGGSAGWHVFVDQLVASVESDARADFDGAYHAAIEARYRRHFGPSVPGSNTRPTLRHGEPDGVVTEAGPGLYDVRFERFFMLPLAKVWAALTEPERLADWFAQAKLDLRVGGEVEFRWESHGYSEKGFIVALDPPRLIAYALPEPGGRHSVVRFELTQEDPKNIGVRLVLTQTLIRAEHLLSIATGWHTHLHEFPEAAARAEPSPWSLERETARSRGEVAEHVPRYRARLPREAAEVPWTH